VDRALGSPVGRWRVAAEVGNEVRVSQKPSLLVSSDNEEDGHRRRDWAVEERAERRPVPTMSGFGEHIHRGMGVRGKKVYAVWRGVRPGIFFLLGRVPEANGWVQWGRASELSRNGGSARVAGLRNRRLG
jgi:hypothetical protein